MILAEDRSRDWPELQRTNNNIFIGDFFFINYIK